MSSEVSIFRNLAVKITAATGEAALVRTKIRPHSLRDIVCVQVIIKRYALEFTNKLYTPDFFRFMTRGI